MLAQLLASTWGMVAALLNLILVTVGSVTIVKWWVKKVTKAQRSEKEVEA